MVGNVDLGEISAGGILCITGREEVMFYSWFPKLTTPGRLEGATA